MPTDIARRSGFFRGTILMKGLVPVLSEISVRISPNGMIRPPRKSAADVVRACFEIDAHPGSALHLNGTDGIEIAKDAKDEAKRRELWEYGVQAAKIEEGDTVLANWK